METLELNAVIANKNPVGRLNDRLEGTEKTIGEQKLPHLNNQETTELGGGSTESQECMKL